MQNIGFNQAKQKRSKISPSKKFSERIEYWKFLEVTDDEGAIQSLMGIKYTVLLANTGSPILNTPHSTSIVFCETKLPT